MININYFNLYLKKFFGVFSYIQDCKDVLRLQSCELLFLGLTRRIGVRGNYNRFIVEVDIIGFQWRVWVGIGFNLRDIEFMGLVLGEVGM